MNSTSLDENKRKYALCKEGLTPFPVACRQSGFCSFHSQGAEKYSSQEVETTTVPSMPQCKERPGRFS